MVFDDSSRLKAPCPYGVRRQGELCPHAVQVALATDRSRVPGRGEGAITSIDVIVARGTGNRALKGLGKRRGGGGGSRAPVGKERAGESECTRVQSMFQRIDVTLS